MYGFLVFAFLLSQDDERSITHCKPKKYNLSQNAFFGIATCIVKCFNRHKVLPGQEHYVSKCSEILMSFASPRKSLRRTKPKCWAEAQLSYCLISSALTWFLLVMLLLLMKKMFSLSLVPLVALGKEHCSSGLILSASATGLHSG